MKVTQHVQGQSSDLSSFLGMYEKSRVIELNKSYLHVLWSCPKKRAVRVSESSGRPRWAIPKQAETNPSCCFGSGSLDSQLFLDTELPKLDLVQYKG